MPGITFFAPAMCAPWRGEDAHSALPEPHVPALHHLLARADRAAQPALAFEDALARVFAVETVGDLPWGALGLWGETGERPAGCVLRLDPVHLRLGMTEAIVTAGAALPLSMAEAQELAQALQEHFAGRGWNIVVAAPQRWYLCVPDAGELVSVPLTHALGRDAGLFKPQGKDARRWLADVNEAQMVLFAHPLNAAREARGVPMVNSVWPWGAGVLLPSPLAPLPLAGEGNGVTPLGGWRLFAAIFANHPLARGLAYALGLPVHDLPETLEECVDMSENALIVLDDLLQPFQDGDFDDWHAALQGLDARWFAPLRAALAQGRFASLQIDTGAAQFVCTPAQRWRFWRTVKPLESLCSAARV